MNEFSLNGLSFCFIDQSDFRPELLHAEERGVLPPDASPSRLVQFGLGRAAARIALMALKKSSVATGAASNKPPSDSPILMSEQGAPLWPSGIIGSISHTRSFSGGQRSGLFSAAAVVASNSRFLSLGIDIEDSERPVSTEALRKMSSTHEFDWAQQQNAVDEATPSSREKSLFLLGAKEALYKALFPLCEQYFGFLDAELEISGPGLPFSIRLKRDLLPAARQGSSFPISFQRLGRFNAVWIALPRTA